MNQLRNFLLVCLVAIGAVACTRAAAQPMEKPSLTLVVRDGTATLTIPCDGPTSMAGCLISAYDSTANVARATNVVRARGTPLVVTWAYTSPPPMPPAIIGVTRIGTAPGFANSDPVLTRIVGNYPAPQAGQPSGTITFTTTPGE